MKNKALVAALMFTAFFFLNSCAARRNGRKTVRPREQYRVAILNAGAYKALGGQALIDIGSFREISPVSSSELRDLLSMSGRTERDLVEARNFARLEAIPSLDFVLVLMPSPPAFAAGSVGLHSVNWRTNTVNTVPAVKVPQRPADWLLEARNGWVRFTSDPPGAIVFSGEKYLGLTPMLAMAERDDFMAELRWTEKDVRSVEVRLGKKNWVHVRAPDDYMAKHYKKGFYARMQDADEEYGEYFFISIYVLVMLASLGLLFYNPLTQQ